MHNGGMGCREDRHVHHGRIAVVRVSGYRKQVTLACVTLAGWGNAPLPKKLGWGLHWCAWARYRWGAEWLTLPCRTLYTAPLKCASSAL